MRLAREAFARASAEARNFLVAAQESRIGTTISTTSDASSSLEETTQLLRIENNRLRAELNRAEQDKRGLSRQLSSALEELASTKENLCTTRDVLTSTLGSLDTKGLKGGSPFVRERSIGLGSLTSPLSEKVPMCSDFNSENISPVEVNDHQEAVSGVSGVINGQYASDIARARKSLVESEQKHQARLKEADIIISGIGKGKYITGDMIKEGAVLIDAGIIDGWMVDWDDNEYVQSLSALTVCTGNGTPLAWCTAPYGIVANCTASGVPYPCCTGAGTGSTCSATPGTPVNFSLLSQSDIGEIKRPGRYDPRDTWQDLQSLTGATRGYYAGTGVSYVEDGAISQSGFSDAFLLTLTAANS